MEYSFLFPVVQNYKNSSKNASAIVENKLVFYVLFCATSSFGMKLVPYHPTNITVFALG